MGDLISRNMALSFPFANGKYDHEHADEHFIFGCESYKEWLEGLPTVDTSDMVSKQTVITAIHEYFKGEIEKTPSEVIDGREVYNNREIFPLLAHNKALTNIIRNLECTE